MGIIEILKWVILFLAGAGLFRAGSLYAKRAALKQKEADRLINESKQRKLIELNNRFIAEAWMLEEILHNVAEGVLVTDGSGKVIWTNRKALEILKTSWNTSVGKLINQVLPGCDEETSRPNFQVNLVSFEGETITINAQTYPYTGGNLEVKGKIYIISDVTKERALEQMKLDFVAIAAHQLRTPLTAVKGYLSLLTESALAKLNKDEQSFLQRSTVSADRLASLIENLLNVSRVEGGALKVAFAYVKIEEVVRHVVEMLSDSACEKQVRLVIDKMVPPYPLLWGDANLLEEALSNIISNGIKYNYPGGQVTIILTKQAEGVTVYVSDNGRGIPASAIGHLFQRFYRATSSLSDLSNGLGLGLYISKSIIDAHRGKIWVNSLEGKGTTVSIFLPKATHIAPGRSYINTP